MCVIHDKKEEDKRFVPRLLREISQMISLRPEVGIVIPGKVILTKDEKGEWKFVRFLPHRIDFPKRDAIWSAIGQTLTVLRQFYGFDGKEGVVFPEDFLEERQINPTTVASHLVEFALRVAWAMNFFRAEKVPRYKKSMGYTFLNWNILSAVIELFVECLIGGKHPDDTFRERIENIKETVAAAVSLAEGSQPTAGIVIPLRYAVKAESPVVAAKTVRIFMLSRVFEAEAPEVAFSEKFPRPINPVLATPHVFEAESPKVVSTPAASRIIISRVFNAESPGRLEEKYHGNDHPVRKEG